SKALCWRNLLFLAINPTFGFLTAFLYLLTAWAVSADIGRLGFSQIGEAITTTLHEVVNKPDAGFWVIAMLLLFFLFTDTHSRLYRVFGGLVHGLAHLAAVFFIAWGAAYLFSQHFEPGSFAFVWRFALAVAAGGWVAGSLILGIYLLVSLNVFQRHSDEAFASLRIQDFKQFLRLRFAADGSLTIFPIGILRVPRRWKEAPAGAGGPGLPPDGPRATAPPLIADPIPAGRTGGRTVRIGRISRRAFRAGGEYGGPSDDPAPVPGQFRRRGIGRVARPVALRSRVRSVHVGPTRHRRLVRLGPDRSVLRQGDQEDE